MDFDPEVLCVSVFQGSLLLNFRVRAQDFLPAYWNMAKKIETLDNAILELWLA